MGIQILFADSLAPEPYPRGKVPVQYVQILVILDDSMIEYYGESHVKEFTLTLMNVVSYLRDYFHGSISSFRF